MALEGLPIIIQQIGYVENIAQAGEHAASINQNTNQQIATEFLKQQNSAVQKNQAADGGKKVEEKEADRQKQGRQGQKQQARSKRDSSDDFSENMPESEEHNPWAGNIINRKI